VLAVVLPPLADVLLEVELEPLDVAPHAESAVVSASTAHSHTIARKRRPRAITG
jgi:hypothetical protein